MCPVLENWPAQEIVTPEGWLDEEMYLHSARTVVWLDGSFTFDGESMMEALAEYQWVCWCPS